MVEKLHAKDPAHRYPSEAEVADVLGRHVAHLQQPSQAPTPAAAKSAEGPLAPERAPRRQRWAVAAAVLAAGLAALGTAEAAGVTSVRATVIRIFTTEGTLVVEADDPAVMVAVEGDGDLVITGAGPREVRLKAGSYRLKATRDGKPVALDRDLVNISRGDRQIVRIRLEADAPAAAPPKVERGAFALLGAGRERNFDTLAEAVASASDGDAVEVRGNGPFETDSLKTSSRCVIRACERFRPVIRLKSTTVSGRTAGWVLKASAPLVLEGLELHADSPAAPASVMTMPNPGNLPELHVANCRLRDCTLIVQYAAACQIRNCEAYPPRGIGAINISNNRARLAFVIDNTIACPRGMNPVTAISVAREGGRGPRSN